MRDHVRLVAFLHIALGVLGLVVGLGGVILLGGMAFFTGGLADLSGAGASFLSAIVAALVLFILLMSVPSIIGGLGLLRFRPWARTLMLVVSALDLANFPIGAAIGAYGLVILFNDDTRRLFEPGRAYNSAARTAG